MPFSFCMTAFSGVAEFNEKLGRFTGVMKDPADAIFDAFKSVTNVTLIVLDEAISLINNKTGAYSGCLGKLQRGEADAAALPMTMPVLGYENITQVNLTGLETGVYMLAPYVTSISSKHDYSNVLKRVTNVSMEVWSHTLVLVLVFWTLMVAAKRINDLAWSKGRRDSPRDSSLFGQPLWYQVMSHMLQTETCDYFGRNERFISILMSVFAFLFFTFLASMMTTEQMTTKAWFAYDSYERILGNKSVQPLWCEYLTDHYNYRDAPSGSLPRQIWEQSLAIEKKYRDKPEHERRNSIVTIDPNEVGGKVGIRAKNQEVVVFATHMFYEIFLAGTCLALPGLPALTDLRFKAVKDTHLKPSYYVLPISRQSKAGPVFELIISRFIEHSLFSDPSTSAKLRDQVAKSLPMKAHYDDSFFECLNFAKFPKGEPKTVPLGIASYLGLFYLSGGVVLIALVIFLFENCKPKRKIRVLNEFNGSARIHLFKTRIRRYPVTSGVTSNKQSLLVSNLCVIKNSISPSASIPLR